MSSSTRSLDSPPTLFMSSQSFASFDLNSDGLSLSEVPSITSESLTMETLSIAESLDDTPPFPSGHRPPIATALSLSSCLSMFSHRSRKTGDTRNEDDRAQIFVTIPTAPRLRTMLRENLCVRRWAESLSALDAPGHIPWGDLGDVPNTSWVPEGSCYPPDSFRAALLSKRGVRDQTTWKLYIPPSPATTAPVSQTPDGNPLVFEQDITVKTGNRSKSLSLHVPAVSMDPEMVDMILQLKNLNTFFRDGLEDSDQPAKKSKETKHKLVPPALVVSDSRSSVPILLNSSAEPLSQLATRRGKTVPPIQSVKYEIDQDSYPSIPTAFLGSPSTHSPKFEFAGRGERPSIDYEEMIMSLRSRCVSLPGRSPSHSSFLRSKCVHAVTPTEIKSPSTDDDDEWAFAQSILEKHSDQLSECQLSELSSSPLSYSSMGGLLSTSSLDAVTASPTEVGDRDPPNKKDKVSRSDIPRPRSPRPVAKTTILPPQGPPTIPLPIPPGTVASSSSQKFMRGILKNCKSVRFASLPTRHESPPFLVKSYPELRGRLAGTSSVPSVRRPSPLRHCHAPHSSASSSETISSFGTPPLPSSTTTRSPRVPRRKPVPALSTPRPPSTLIRVGAPKCSPANPPRRPPVEKQVSTPTPAKPVLAKSSVGRRSLGRLSLTPPAKGKENKPALLRWATLDENVMRRASLPSQRDNKSRMPTPLRNIFTRFK